MTIRPLVQLAQVENTITTPIHREREYLVQYLDNHKIIKKKLENTEIVNFFVENLRKNI